ncbi:hypothetical protein SKAU_G00157060 [Synaphobranchus kaupii]|uniref:C2H2-type domain-containing protein n=1 Tax=Synaphobranchus kaupii TaxID=118154 RepID=A0A9Q1FHX3_SYNKA|nr:hypothetical protein SKAU_G00157060 [Synaphobranchus kaupii]
MPRSFLVKQIKLDDFSSSAVSSNHHHHHLDESYTFARSITESVASLGVHLSENGYIKDYITPSVYQSERRAELKKYSQTSSGGEEYSDPDMEHPDMEHPDSPQSGVTGSGFFSAEAEALTEGYTMDAFFISDGRSRRKGKTEDHGRGRGLGGGSGGGGGAGSCERGRGPPRMQRVRQDLRHLLQPQSAQADAPQPGRQDGAQVPHLQQDLRVHAGTGHARAHPRPQAQVRRVQQGLQPAPGSCRVTCAHTQTHSAFKHYRCKRCDKTFALKSYLNKHYESACIKGSTDEEDSCSEN